MNKNISLKESIAVLIVLLALLGVLIIGFQLSPHIPILAAFMCLLADLKSSHGMRSMTGSSKESLQGSFQS